MLTRILVFGLLITMLAGLVGCQKKVEVAEEAKPAAIAKAPPPAVPEVVPESVQAPPPTIATPTTEPEVIASATVPAKESQPTPATISPSPSPNQAQPANQPVQPAPTLTPTPIQSTIKTTPETEFLLDANLGLFLVTAGRNFGKPPFENTIMGDRYKETHSQPLNSAFNDVKACTTNNEYELERAIGVVTGKLSGAQYARDLAAIRRSFEYWKQQNNRTTYR